MDWQRVHAILDIVQGSDVIDSLQSNEECDVLHVSDHDSDSETDLYDDDNLNDYINYRNGYKCKNGNILSKYPKESSLETNNKIKDVINLRKNNLQALEFCPRPINAWQTLFTDDLLELMVTSSNHKISRNHDVMESTNVREIRTLIGILYYHGIMRPTYQECGDLWHNEYGAVCVQNGMTFKRFKFLLENLSFDVDNDDNVVQFDAMSRIRKVFEIFALNCRNSLNVGNLVVMDEVILPFDGPCPFRYNIKNKKIQNGIKLTLLIDPLSFYVSNLDVITDPYFTADAIVTKLVQHLAGSGRTVVMDSWFTSSSLITKLKNEYTLYSIARLHHTDDIIPPVFLSRYRNDIPFITGFVDKDMIVNSYYSNSQLINVVTNDPMYYKRVHTSGSSSAATYKKYQSSVEVLDVLMHYYTTMQPTNSWVLSLFFMLLNIACINAQVIWSMHRKNDVVQRRIFIRELALSLIEANEPRPFLSNVNRKLNRYSIPRDIVGNVSKRRCKICSTSFKRDRKTKQMCIKCGIYICREHTVQFCTICGS